MSDPEERLSADESVARDPDSPSGARAAAMDRLLDVKLPGLRVILESWRELGDPYLKGYAIYGLVGRLHLEEHVSAALRELKSPVLPSDPDGDGDDLVGQILSREFAAAALGTFARDSGKDPESIRTALAGALINTNFPNLRKSIYEALLCALGEQFPTTPIDFRLDRDVDWQRVGPYVGRAIELGC